jgi:hypothetical protein
LAGGFADRVAVELRLMEDYNTRFRERGGYYLTVHPGGGTSARYPARAAVTGRRAARGRELREHRATVRGARGVPFAGSGDESTD